MEWDIWLCLNMRYTSKSKTSYYHHGMYKYIYINTANVKHHHSIILWSQRCCFMPNRTMISIYIYTPIQTILWKMVMSHLIQGYPTVQTTSPPADPSSPKAHWEAVRPARLLHWRPCGGFNQEIWVRRRPQWWENMGKQVLYVLLFLAIQVVAWNGLGEKSKWVAYLSLEHQLQKWMHTTCLSNRIRFQPKLLGHSVAKFPPPRGFVPFLHHVDLLLGLRSERQQTRFPTRHLRNAADLNMTWNPAANRLIHDYEKIIEHDIMHGIDW